MAVRAKLTAYELDTEDLTAAYSEATRSRLERRAPTLDPVAVEHRIIAPTLANEPASRASALFLFSPDRPTTRPGRRRPLARRTNVVFHLLPFAEICLRLALVG
jgi:hypothetical protein